MDVNGIENNAANPLKTSDLVIFGCLDAELVLGFVSLRTILGFVCFKSQRRYSIFIPHSFVVASNICYILVRAQAHLQKFKIYSLLKVH